MTQRPWSTRSTVLIVSTLFVTHTALVGTVRGDDKAEGEHAPMAEPLFNETMTDIDGDEPGEVEFEANGSRWQSVKGGAYAMQGTIEVEWLATRHLGIFVEPLFTQSLETSAAKTSDTLGVNFGLSWKLLQDFQRDFHVQAELGGRYPLDPSLVTDPGDPALPFTFDVRAGLRRGRWTLRGSAGGEAGGAFAHVPFRGSVGIYTPFGSSDRYGFLGVEADADGGRRYPVVISLNLIPSLVPVGVPFRIGLGIPWAVGELGTRPVVGLLVRLFVEGEREISYGRDQPSVHLAR